MEFRDVVRGRRIVRHFKPDPIDPGAIERILALAQRAPSAGYTQGQSFIVVTDPSTAAAGRRTCWPMGWARCGA